MPTTANDKAPQLSLNERRQLSAAIQARGEHAVRPVLDVSRDALCRALAGLPVRRGTILLIQTGLAALEAQSTEVSHG